MSLLAALVAFDTAMVCLLMVCATIVAWERRLKTALLNNIQSVLLFVLVLMIIRMWDVWNAELLQALYELHKSPPEPTAVFIVIASLLAAAILLAAVDLNKPKRS